MTSKPDFVYSPPSVPLEIVHVDKDVLCVVKPSGLLSVPGRGEHVKDSLYTRLLIEWPRARVVHRLDMDTSGIMIFALRRKAERTLKIQFQERRIQKRYETIVYGLTPQSGVIDEPLMADPTRKLRHIVHPSGKTSETHFETLIHHDEMSLVSLVPKTGRSHQLRVHLMHIGHPILGDRFYAPQEVCSKSDRLMLHSAEIGFAHPYSGQQMHFTAPSGFDSWLETHTL
mgnify:FL=1